MWTAATQTHFCHPSNRFYPALRGAGLIDWELDAKEGMTPAQREQLAATGIGITNLVPGATARASEVATTELAAGVERLRGLVERVRPRVVVVAGITAYRVAFADPVAVLGERPSPFPGAAMWVIPNPSGLNAHVTTAGMATWLRRVAEAAGITADPGNGGNHQVVV